jgi:hypothetical protein
MGGGGGYMRVGVRGGVAGEGGGVHTHQALRNCFTRHLGEARSCNTNICCCCCCCCCCLFVLCSGGRLATRSTANEWAAAPLS